MKFTHSLLTLAAAGAVSLSGADISKIADAKRWKPDESTVTQSGKAMVINMPVDHKAGQKDYPIGWPRLYLYKLNAAEKDWSKAKAVSFNIKLEFTGKSTKQPVFFQVRTQGAGEKKVLTHMLPLPALVNNKTTTVTLSLDKVKNLNNVVILGFNINESQYKHGENVKFTVSDFKLINK